MPGAKARIIAYFIQVRHKHGLSASLWTIHMWAIPTDPIRDPQP
jgi:hypothetical protein